jgi:Asp-tRNA(Asn)/Glu-tRNA(Gln) amidotransferase A subunit family amidase
MMEALADGFVRAEAPRPADLHVGVAWLERCDPLVRRQLERLVSVLPGARPLDFPVDEGTSPLFMHEVADVHRDLFAESADSYGPSVRGKIERCLAVTDSEAAEAARRREDYREAADRALGELDLLLVPTLAFVAPPLPEDEREIRERVLQFTYPFNVLGWPVLALPAGPAEDGLPASAQLVGRPGADALVLAVGEVLEASLERGTA